MAKVRATWTNGVDSYQSFASEADAHKYVAKCAPLLGRCGLVDLRVVIPDPLTVQGLEAEFGTPDILVRE